MRTSTPEMNITNQINAALNDMRSTLIDLSCTPNTNQAITLVNKARYQMNLAMDMIMEHSEGRSQPWSDRKYQVDEEFS